jgi:PhnB protein
MPALNPYLNFPGNTEEAFNFYKSVFGGEFAMVMRFKDTPEAEKMSPQDRNKLMHIALPIGKNNVLMGTDTIESMGQKLGMGNNLHISIHTESKAEADRIFGALFKGGKIEVPIGDMFWGDYFGMGTDKFGVHWMVSFSAQNRN